MEHAKHQLQFHDGPVGRQSSREQHEHHAEDPEEMPFARVAASMNTMFVQPVNRSAMKAKSLPWKKNALPRDSVSKSRDRG
jgi:hypothetical protein